MVSYLEYAVGMTDALQLEVCLYTPVGPMSPGRSHLQLTEMVYHHAVFSDELNCQYHPSLPPGDAGSFEDSGLECDN